MAATFDWVVEWMKNYPEHDGQQNVVFQVGWRCNATETANDKVYSTSSYGSLGVEYKGDTPFTPYENLTEQQVMGWLVDAGLDKAQYETALQNELNSKINPTQIQSPLPWAA